MYRILKWVEKEGEPQAEARVKMMILKPAAAEKINLFAVKPDTPAGPSLIQDLKAAAHKVVGRPFPS